MKKVLIAIVTLFFVSQAAAYSIGLAPPQTNLGQVERGETYEVEFYLVASDLSQPETLEPVAGRVSSNTLEGMGQQNYFDYDEYSAEPVAPWINFDQDTYTVRPGDASYEVAGREVSANVSFFLDVPSTAEPGYHAVNIQFEPQQSEGEGSSIQTIALMPHKVFFRVPGDAERELSIEEMNGVRTDNDAVRVTADVRNTGTVTTYLPPQRLDVSSEQGPGGSVGMGGEYIPPGETVTIERTWSKLNQEIDAGNYRVTGSLDYATGSAFVDETFTISDFIQITPGGGSGEGIIPSGQDGSSPPTFLILMFLVIVGSIMYAFEIDPLLIILSMASLGAMAFIYFSGLPLYVAGAVLVMTVALFYYGWL